MWNRAFFRTIRVRDGTIADFTYEEPFASMLGSHNGSMVVLADRCANRSAVLLKGAILGIPSSGGPPIDSRKR
jgi:hypothetical protein